MYNYFLKTGLKYFLCIICLVLVFSTPAFGAEILQVRSSTLLQIGDQNRSYALKIACLNVQPANEEIAIKILKKKLPRRKRVNLRPQGSENGMLIAKVIPLGQEKDIGQELILSGLGENICNKDMSMEPDDI